MIEPYIKQSHKIRADERESAFWSAALLLGACVLASLLFWIVFWLFEIPIEYTKICVVLLVAYYGWKAGVVIIYGWWRGEVRADRVFVLGQNLVKAHQRHVYPEPTPLPVANIPQQITTMPITKGVTQPELIGGIDVDDLRMLCAYIVRRRKWTAETLEGMELPKSHLIITNKDTKDGQGNPKDTTYKRVMSLFERAHAFDGRDKGKTGTLTTGDSDELLKMLRGIGTIGGQQELTKSNQT